jgi:fructose-bisphosphate aldolase class II
MEKGVIDLIPAAVEAVKQETMKKMKLFGSDGKANIGGGMSPTDIETITKLVMAEIKKQLNK